MEKKNIDWSNIGFGYIRDMYPTTKTEHGMKELLPPTQP